ncbi:mitogen-activated protein kinase 4 [Nannochloropsis gaditana CCMP526]|uniref:mitogen-activated protein kinase 4 n=1 Tax=Nannochloropsis gaditana (strain CCMP526) TaxID=1093141 RepID=UPI00029F6B82|nr:mitogen-activated protein kinase 4 [Nannochloropsis gaditana CCMP526]EKU21961.1 mitogen-activated protein kinase 4 [Nannochloropsis gaditana CCMP526]|eukprot:XP_005854396.1 mitogen-activated protein kinase 4 [Nannochloropsis gaditana CCMP526]
MEGYLQKQGFVFSSRRYFVLTNTGLLCYANKEDRSEVRDSFPLAPDTQVVEIKIKDKLKLRLKSEGLTWTLSADEDDEAEGRRWADALATAVARLASLSKGHPPGGHGEGTRELAHNPARKVVVIEVGGQGERILQHLIHCAFPPFIPSAFHSAFPQGTEFVIDPRYEVTRRLGNGAYGVVVAAKDTVTGKAVAIKKCFNIFQSLSDAKKIAREVRLLRQMDHPNITRITTVIPPLSATFDEVYIVSELMDIDMHNLMYLSREKITPDHVQFFIYQVLCGIKYMHALNIIHRDLKPSNLLINANCDLKICDFGLARGIQSNGPAQDKECDLTAADAAAPEKPKDLLSEYVVTRWYRAPEILLNPRNYSKPVDIWAVGTIFGELLARKPMFPAHNYDHLIRLQTRTLGSPSEENLKWVTREKARTFMRSLPQYPRRDFKSLYPEASGPALDLLEKILQWDPAKRPTAAEALSHPYFDDIRDADFEQESDLIIDWGDLETMRTTKLNLQRYLIQDMVSMNPESSALLKMVAHESTGKAAGAT